ncbi:MAG: SRPBCC domain-containing protein [Streptosporangiales bacterium]|nr:SRPBCC domain-containing protein [Streptosporangiales bacterium]
MSVTSIDKDFDNLSLTVIADFEATTEQVWQLWADPRQLERWWGPPTCPATVEEHELTPGGSVTYYLTGPEGDSHRGWWRVTAANPPKSLEFVDGFAYDDGTPNTELPTTTVRMQLTVHGAGTRMEMRSAFESRDQMEQLVNMGMAEGIEQSVGQMDALLAT